MRILYANGGNGGFPGGRQLHKHLPLFRQSKHQFRIAAFSYESEGETIDYCLDSLLNFLNPNGPILFNSNYLYYAKELEKFKPDLIISDLEIYTSLFAVEKQIPLWQFSEELFYYGLTKSAKQKLGLNKYHAVLFSGNRKTPQYHKHIIQHSTRKLIPPHLEDQYHQLLPGFEWCESFLDLLP